MQSTEQSGVGAAGVGGGLEIRTSSMQGGYHRGFSCAA